MRTREFSGVWEESLNASFSELLISWNAWVERLKGFGEL